jgi:hypothetical protein
MASIVHHVALAVAIELTASLIDVLTSDGYRLLQLIGRWWLAKATWSRSKMGVDRHPEGFIGRN